MKVRTQSGEDYDLEQYPGLDVCPVLTSSGGPATTTYVLWATGNVSGSGGPTKVVGTYPTGELAWQARDRVVEARLAGATLFDISSIGAQ